MKNLSHIRMTAVLQYHLTSFKNLQSIVIDNQLGPQSDVLPHPQRIFLYNRQVLTGEQNVPPSPLLFPMIVGVPDVDDVTIGLTSNVSALLEKASSPLLRALPDFERQFLRNLKR